MKIKSETDVMTFRICPSCKLPLMQHTTKELENCTFAILGDGVVDTKT